MKLAERSKSAMVCTFTSSCLGDTYWGPVLACPISKSRDAPKNSRLKIHALNLRRQDSRGPEVKLHHFRPNFWSEVDALNVKKMVSSASQYHTNDCGYIKGDINNIEVIPAYGKSINPRL